MDPTSLTINLAPFGVDPEGTPHQAHPTQMKILEWADRVRAGTSGAQGIPVLYAQGGWRSGKTRAMLAVVLEVMEAYPGIRVLIGRKDFNDLRLSTMESWRDVRPRALVKHEDKQEHREEWVNGSQVFFRELKDLEGLGGQEFGLILISEPYELDADIYIRAKGRISQAGMPHMLLLEGNPPNEGHWLHKVVLGDDHTPPDPDVTFLEVATDENWTNLPEAYRRSIESAPLAWQKKYRLGQWGFTPEGQPVYDIFREQLHVSPVGLVPDRPVLRSWDSGVRHPACLWGQTTAGGQLLIQHEELGIEVSLSGFAPRVIQKTNEQYGPKLVMDYGDPAMFGRSVQTGKTDAQVLYEIGKIQLRGRQSTHQDRKSLIDGRFSLLINGAPAVLIHPRCKTLIEALMGGYHYPKRSEGQAFSKPHQAPFKDGWYEHLANCFEYLIVNTYGAGSSAALASFTAKRRYRQQQQRHQSRSIVTY